MPETTRETLSEGVRPVLYLDVDGVLWDVKEGAPPIADVKGWAKGADGVEDFMEWALATFEVRWCTTWAMGGTMRWDGLKRLEEYTGVPAETWAKVKPGRGWMHHKGENVAWEEHRAGRPFAWVEDELLPQELQMLAGNGFSDCYVYTDVFDDPQALRKAHAALRARFTPSDSVVITSSSRPTRTTENEG